MYSHLVHNLPTYKIPQLISNVNPSVRILNLYLGTSPVLGHRLTGRSSSPKISQANLMRSNTLYFESNTLPIVSSWVLKSTQWSGSQISRDRVDERR